MNYMMDDLQSATFVKIFIFSFFIVKEIVSVSLLSLLKVKADMIVELFGKYIANNLVRKVVKFQKFNFRRKVSDFYLGSYVLT